MHPVTYFAYLDAGTGSLIVQSLVGIAAGVAVFGRRLFGGIKHRIVSLFKREKKSDDKK